MRLTVLPLLATLTFATPAFAQPAPLVLPAGQTMLNISATERQQVSQDLLNANLRVEKTGPDAKALQNDINTLMKAAADKVKAVSTVKLSTGGYYVYEETPAPTKEIPKPKKSWRGSQSIDIKSTNAEDLLKLTGELQDLGLMVGGLGYSLSPEKADEVKDNLMEAALAKVKTRAERAAKAMGKSQTDLLEINVDAADNGPQPYPVMRAMVAASPMMEKMAVPTAEPGETEITLTVSAKALLKP